MVAVPLRGKKPVSEFDHASHLVPRINNSWSYASIPYTLSQPAQGQLSFYSEVELEVHQ